MKFNAVNKYDEVFYEAHRNELKEDRKLKSAWDRFVFGRPRETDDFLSGIALCFESLFSQQSASASRTLTIRCDRATKKDLKDLNVDAGLYFATRYRGLRTLLGSRVRWEVGKLFDFPALVDEWRTSRKASLNRSQARAALQLKFLLELEVALPGGGSETHTAQLMWAYDPSRVSSEFVSDWEADCAAPARGLQHKQRVRRSEGPVSDRGPVQRQDLRSSV